jgi:hypothetical protein
MASTSRKIVAARAEREKVATTGDAERTIRKNYYLAPDVVDAGDELLFKLRRARRPISWSALVEIALRELLNADNREMIIATHGAVVRRKLGASHR